MIDYCIGSDEECGIFLTNYEENYSPINMINVFPNPASDFILIDLELSGKDDWKLLIHDNSGKTVLNKKFDLLENQVNIPLTGIEKGMYYLVIYNGEQQTVCKKIIKIN